MTGDERWKLTEMLVPAETDPLLAYGGAPPDATVRYLAGHDADTGNDVWRYEPPSSTAGTDAPVAAGDVVFVSLSSDTRPRQTGAPPGGLQALSGGEVVAVDAHTGRQRWSLQHHLVVTSAIRTSDQDILLVDSDILYNDCA